ncbi:MAG TPA: hypothetical protein PKD68_03120 [Candidatus Saccharibacteria bacterium]|nr:hypothetical protein [Candidatus Saccharibacteria bacterium]
MLFVPGEHDTVAVMAYHEPMLMRLAAGKVMVREGHNTNQVAEIQHGIMYVGDNEVSVLVAKHGSVKEAITE